MLIFLPFISSVDASFRSNGIHTLAVGCVKSHFLFAGIRCCWVIVHLDLASYLALLTGRAILVTAYITIYSKFNPNLSVPVTLLNSSVSPDLLAGGTVTLPLFAKSRARHSPQNSSPACGLCPVSLDLCLNYICSHKEKALCLSKLCYRQPWMRVGTNKKVGFWRLSAWCSRETLAVQARGAELGSSAPNRKQDIVTCACNPSTGRGRDKQIWGACWPASPVECQVRGVVSKNMM